tara:strand:- start:683 stop:1303 length:621 start_codon:yes stop_codon:yes gene_type:complete
MYINSRRKNINADDDDDIYELDEEVKTIGNSIFFYADVSVSTIMKLNVAIRHLQNEILKKNSRHEETITLYIHSNGGDVFAGLSGMDHIKTCKVPINTVVDGMAASAATFLVLGGVNKYMMPHSYMLIHQIKTGMWFGKYEELKDEVSNCDQIMKQLKRLYSENTKLPMKNITELMKHDLCLEAKECIKHKIVDSYYTGDVCQETL